MSNNKKNDKEELRSKAGNMSRRTFLKGSAVAVAAASGSALAHTNYSSKKKHLDFDDEYDYVIVGAGPGGGPVAANLARAGYRVAILEAGLDPMSERANKADPSTSFIYETPGFFGGASEHALLSWDFFTDHFANLEQQRKDFKYVEGKGVLYPRGSCLGGSASHNALIFCYPHDSDFDEIVQMTGDESWNSAAMRDYFVRIEDCQYCQPDAEGHGFNGYIPTSLIEQDAYEIFPEFKDIGLAGATLSDSYYQGNTELDVNHPLVATGSVGYFKTPMNTLNKKRVAIRERLIETQQQYPDNLFIITNALVTKVVTHKKMAVGVEYMAEGGQSYKAHKLSEFADKGVKTRIRAKREVILAGGAFNTPQLLKLSGIGPRKELKQHGIKVVKHLPGVGENLQDRYEVPVIFNLKDSNKLFERCQAFQVDDPCLASYINGEWQTDGQVRNFSGPYASNPVYASRIMKSSHAKNMPDIFLVGLPIAFKGYYPQYSLEPITNHWTWLVLKVHNENSAGRVKLRSADPTDTPLINFHYFEEGNADESDLKAVVEGIRHVREFMLDGSAQQHLAGEAIPGIDVDSDEQLEQYIRNVAWGHHASCTAKIGSDRDPMAVLDSRFRVRGVANLRVVDASAFPKTPGFFPTAAIIMISEKASDVILADAECASDVKCHGYASWDPKEVYTEGDMVTYNGIVYRAKWFSKGDNPDNGHPWREVDPIARPWRSDLDYERGDQVVYEQQTYQARWYSANEKPANSKAWKLVK
ncbi:GMC oxidoreductase [Pseudoalteromonas sp. T1lg23B]|uniref:GMC oxidoreductase n=1 Tax=Pseudoalteromonas sp. T1lg23B TaxID=2077097 RepID=UPI000CF60FE1|nr:GMC oxidoreductase [Pseudoalteromonas sp. T1lg23B]